MHPALSIDIRDIRKKYDEHSEAVKGVSLNIQPGEFMVLVGPSGCGKSTLLRMIAGLESISSGDLLFDGARMNDVAARDRDVGMVFQNYALYPHLTVFENVAFPLRVRKESDAAIRTRVHDVAEMLSLSPYLERLPKQLSGGQRQRVAVGRAIVRKPRLFLFDEPLSNLDAHLRIAMRTELTMLQREAGTTALYVTHDHTEAMTMGDRIAVLKDGRLIQVGTPHELYAEPCNTFVATFLGTPSMNIVSGRIVNAEGLRFMSDHNDMSLDAARLRTTRPLQAGEEVSVGFRAEDLHHCSEQGDVTLPVAAVEFVGHESLVYAGDPGHLICARYRAGAAPRRHETLHFRLAYEHAVVFDTKGHRR